jgi:hypothetical protein
MWKMSILEIIGREADVQTLKDLMKADTHRSRGPNI